MPKYQVGDMIQHNFIFLTGDMGRSLIIKVTQRNYHTIYFAGQDTFIESIKLIDKNSDLITDMFRSEDA